MSIFQKALAVSLLVLATAGAAVTPVAPAPTPHDAAHLLAFPDGTCSATAIAPRALLTATHCFTEGGNVTQLKVDGRMVDIWRRMDDGQDHTIIMVSEVFAAYAHLGPAPAQGENVHMYGNPAELRDMYRRGYMMGQMTQHGQTVLLFRLPTFFGDSGSGVFDDQGELVAVITGVTMLSSHGYTLQIAVTLPLAFTVQQYVKAGL